jgi:hypothetical protein
MLALRFGFPIFRRRNGFASIFPILGLHVTYLLLAEHLII